MAIITNTRLLLGKSSNSNMEFAEVSFDLDLTAQEKSYSPGFLLHIILIRKSEVIDDYLIGSRPGELELNILKSNAVGASDIFIEVFKAKLTLGPNYPMHIVKALEWDYNLGGGNEYFLAKIALIPLFPGVIFPILVTTQEIKIDIG